MYTLTAEKAGDSLVLTIPAGLQAALQLEPGSQVEIDIDAHTLSPSPKRSKYTLQELLDQCDFSLPMSEEDKEWDAMQPVGRELI